MFAYFEAPWFCWWGRSLYILHICILGTIVDGFDKRNGFVVQFGKMKTKIVYNYVVCV